MNTTAVPHLGRVAVCRTTNNSCHPESRNRKGSARSWGRLRASMISLRRDTVSKGIRISTMDSLSSIRRRDIRRSSRMEVGIPRKVTPQGLVMVGILQGQGMVVVMAVGTAVGTEGDISRLRRDEAVGWELVEVLR